MADEIFKSLADEIHSRRLKCFIFADLGSSSSSGKKTGKKTGEEKRGEKVWVLSKSVHNQFVEPYIGTYMYIYID